MKKILTFVFILITALVMSVTAFAADRYVYDYAGVLSSSEAASLESKCREIHDKYDFDVVVITTSNTSGKSIRGYAMSIFNDGTYSKYGVVYTVDLGERDYDIVATDGTNGKFDGVVDDVFETTGSMLSVGKYNSAFTYLTGRTESFLSSGVDFDTKSAKQIATYVVISTVIGLIISYIIVKRHKDALSTAVKQHGAANYMRQGSAKINVSRDMFLYSTTTRIRRQTESNGSGGGHISSGGGRTGKF